MEFENSYLEVDIMHATIERPRNHKKMDTTQEWALLFSTARIKPSPYKLTNIHYDEFYDIEKLVK